jgi:hypothetical protein
LDHGKSGLSIDGRLHFAAQRHDAADFSHLLNAGRSQSAWRPKAHLVAVHAADERREMRVRWVGRRVGRPAPRGGEVHLIDLVSVGWAQRAQHDQRATDGPFAR